MENQTLCGQQRPASVRQSTPLYPMQGVWSNTPVPQSLPQHSPPQLSGSCPLLTPPQISPSYIPPPHSPFAQSFKDPKIASPLLFSSKHEDTETFIHLCILYINGCSSEFGTRQIRLSGFFRICKLVQHEHGANMSCLRFLRRHFGTT